MNKAFSNVRVPSALPLIGVVVFALSLVGCEARIEHGCGSGVCCAFYERVSEDGEATPDWYNCVAKPGDCTTEKQGVEGSPIVPAKPKEPGQCNATEKEVWVWEGDYWTANEAPSTSRFLAEYAFKQYVSALKKALTERQIPVKDACYNVCTAPDADPDLCFEPRVPNDVALGLLRTYSAATSNIDIGTKVWPIADVYTRFNIIPTDVCERGDIFLDDGTLLNNGVACDPLISAGIAGAKISVDLAVPRILGANLNDNKKGAFYEKHEEAISIVFAEAAFKPLDGVITYSRSAGDALTPDGATIVQVETAEGPWCGQIKSLESADQKFSALLTAVDQSPDAVIVAVSSAVEWFGAQEGLVEGAREASPGLPELLPLTSELSTLEDQVDQPALTAVIEDALRSAGHGEVAKTLTPRAALYVADLVWCNERLLIEDDAISSLYPVLDLRDNAGENLNSVKAARNTAAGHLLRCLTLQHRVSTGSLAQLQSGLSRFLGKEP